MAEYVQVAKRALQQLRGHGGLRGALVQFFRVNDLKTGTLVGTDKYGNNYYEDNRYFFGRHRWVVYTEEMNGKNTFWEVDGSMVPPECLSKAATFQHQKPLKYVYINKIMKTRRKAKHQKPGRRPVAVLGFRHRWLHCMTDDPPTTQPPVARKFIWDNHKFNLSATPGQYVPYSTTRKKIQEWIPPSAPSK